MNGNCYYAAACQTAFDCPTSRAEITQRTERMCELVEQTIQGYEPFFDVRLFVFPEFAHAAPIFDDIRQIQEHLAVELPNEHTDRYHALAQKHGCFIQTGTFLESDPEYQDVVFNTTMLIGPGGILSRYRKVNPWLPWEIHSSPHDFAEYAEEMFPVVETELGCLGVAICYDWLFPETIRQLAFNGAEILLRVSAYMDPWGATTPMDWWTLFNRTRAVENTCFVVASNQAATRAQFPPYDWPGGSMIVDYDGRILAQAEAGSGERVVVAPIDLSRLRDVRKRRRGHDMLRHLRTEAHTYLQQPGFPRAGAEDHPLTKEANDRRIRQSRSLPESLPGRITRREVEE